MAKVSDIAKENIIAALRSIYPESAIVDKKLYINMNIEGEETQIAVTLTAPKVKVAIGTSSSQENDFTLASSKETFSANERVTLEREVDDIFDFFKM